MTGANDFMRGGIELVRTGGTAALFDVISPFLGTGERADVMRERQRIKLEQMDPIAFVELAEALLSYPSMLDQLTALAIPTTVVVGLLVILAVLIVLVTHFLLGPYSAGQRDFLMSIPALAAALASAKAAEDQQHDRFYLVLVGVFAMTAASIKPSGMLLLLLPVFTRVKRDWRELQWVIIGAAGTGILVFGTLAAWGGLEPFITTMQGLMPRYASLGARTVLEISEDVVVWLAPTAGLALAAVLNISAPKPPRVRAMIGLTLFALAAEPIWRRMFAADDIDRAVVLRHTLALLDKGLGGSHAH